MYSHITLHLLAAETERDVIGSKDLDITKVM